MKLLLRALNKKSGLLPSQYAFEARPLPHVQAVLSNIQEYSSFINCSEYEERFGPPSENLQEGSLLRIYKFVEGRYLWVRNILEESMSSIFSWAYTQYRPTGDTWWLACKLSKTLVRHRRYRDAEIFLRWEFLEATKALNAEHPKCLTIFYSLTTLLLPLE